MKIAICNELFQGWPIERVFEYGAPSGYDGVEIAPYTLADSVTEICLARRRAIRRAVENTGIEIVGLHWLLVKPEGLYINHPDDIVRIRTQEYMVSPFDPDPQTIASWSMGYLKGILESLGETG